MTDAPMTTPATDIAGANRPKGMPDDTPDYAAPAWAACLSWAIGKAEIRAEFEAETGRRYTAPKTPIDAAIDKATGYSDAYVAAFIEWANANIWGAWDDSPEE